MNAIPTIYDGVEYRSRTEAKWKMLFDKIKIQAEYEPSAFSVRAGHVYRPDFYFPEYDVYGEVKTSDEHLHDPDFSAKVGVAIDFGRTPVSKGLILLGNFPYDVRIIDGLELRMHWLHHYKGVVVGEAVLFCDLSGYGHFSLTSGGACDSDVIPDSASTVVTCTQTKEPIFRSKFLYNAIKDVQKDIYGEEEADRHSIGRLQHGTLINTQAEVPF